MLHKWWGDGLEAHLGADTLAEISNDIPEDINMLWYTEPGNTTSYTDNPNYRFGYKDYTGAQTHSIGETVVLLTDWSELDNFLENFPTPHEEGSFDGLKIDGRYTLGCFWRFFHERLWTVRGMENLMMDYYDYMDELKILCARFLEFYKVIIDRYHALGCDGIFTSDDLGFQTGPMMSPAIFEELYLPFYKEFIGYAHEKKMHVFLHSCGDNTLLMDYLIEAGLDVFHPVQKGPMDMAKTAERFGEQITFLVGVDVQDLLPNATADEVQAEIAEMKRIFKPERGMLLSMGNGILHDTPKENIRAALVEMIKC